MTLLQDIIRFQIVQLHWLLPRKPTSSPNAWPNWPKVVRGKKTFVSLSVKCESGQPGPKSGRFGAPVDFHLDSERDWQKAAFFKPVKEVPLILLEATSWWKKRTSLYIMTIGHKNRSIKKHQPLLWGDCPLLYAVGFDKIAIFQETLFPQAPSLAAN